MTKELTDTDFWQEVEKTSVLYLVEFWAIWSASCVAISQLLEDIAGQFEGKLIVGKVNVDNEIKTSNDCNIQNIPTIVIYDHGKEIERIMGSISKEILINKIMKHIPKKGKKTKGT